MRRIRWPQRLSLLMGLWAAAAIGAPGAILAERMQRFVDGSLRGFALAELPDDGREIYRESDFADLAATGANVVRVPILLRKCAGCGRYATPEADIRYAQRILERGERHGLRVILVLVAMPWGDGSDYWDSASLKADIVSQWGGLARRLKGYPALQAYDLINEPVVPAAQSAGNPQARWHELALAIARELRQADPDTPLIIEPTPWGLPSSFQRTEPLAGPGLVYSFHFYEPHAFTHQGLPGQPAASSYPAPDLDLSRLDQALADARRFAARHRVPMFVGEFSCVRWAPGGSCPRYIADAVALFEAAGWGWAYHCWRCYQGWDAELPEQAAPGPGGRPLPAQRRADSPTLQILERAMARRRPRRVSGARLARCPTAAIR